MFNPIRRWYDQNRHKLWAVIIIIAMILFFINSLNDFYKNKEVENNTKTSSVKETINNQITGQLDSTTSLISGTGVDTEKLKNDTIVIDDFISKCSQGKIQEAYDLLTEECKEEVFPTIESFERKYYKNVFSTPKTYSLQNWNGRTYKVMIIDDALSTGKVSQTNTHLQEYMTIIPTDNGYKLNINNYVGRKVKNKTLTEKDVEVTFIKKETYMNYEEYTVKIKNLTDKEIILDNGEATNTIYLLDDNGIKEYANTGNINYETLKIVPGASREYTFKFSNAYSSTRTMEFLVFEKAIMDNTNEEIKYQKISIDL